MSIDVYYQPIDVNVVRDSIFPFVRGVGEVTHLESQCEQPEEAIAILTPLRNAYAARRTGTDYEDPSWGTCDPTEFIADRFVPSVLEFCRHIWPSWFVPAYSSIHVLPDFPVLNYYSMPIVLFDEFARYVPDIAPELKTIAECENMGGVILSDKVPFVLQIANDALKQAVRDPAEPYAYDGLIELQKALAYSAEHELAFTEAFE